MSQEPEKKNARQIARDRRFLSLELALVAAIFAGVALGGLLMMPLETPDTSPALAALKTQLEKNPANEALKEVIRDLDLKLREEYFYRLRLRSAGAMLLLGGAAAVALFARLYASLDPKSPMPTTPAERADEARWLKLRRTNRIAFCIAAAAVGVAFVVMIGRGSALPRASLALINAPQKEMRPSSRSAAILAAASAPANITPSASAPAATASQPSKFKDNWPSFRGPTGMGIAPAGEWPRSWNGKTGENILWKAAVPLPGKNSPVVWGDRIFLTGAEGKRQEVYCFDRSNGRLLWTAKIQSPKPPEGEEEEVFKDTGYAAPTAATDGARVYVTFASADVAAVDFAGNVVWVQNLGKPESSYGLAASLAVHKNLVIMQFDRGSDESEKLSAIIAMDGATGKEAWRTARAVPNSWASPVVAETELGPEILTAANPWVIAYDPDLGTEMWRAKGLSGDVAPSPVYAGGKVFVTGEGAKVMAIRDGGLGDVTETHMAWSAEEGMADAASPIATEKYFLQINSSGRMTCYDASEGKLLWDERLDGTYWASPILAGSTVYVFGEDGKALLFELASEYKANGIGDIGEAIYATPAFCDSHIYIRTKGNLYCIGK